MSDSISIAPVASFQSSIAGHACANTLTAMGVHATVVGDYTSEFRVGGSGTVQVLVKQAQLEDAKRLLEQIKVDSNDSEESEYSATEPNNIGWKRILVWMIFWFHVAGLFAYFGVSLIKILIASA